MSAAKAPVPRRRAKQTKGAKCCKQFQTAVEAALSGLYKTHALLIATQFAANHEAEFAISVQVDQHIETLDRLRIRLRWEGSN